MPRPTISAADAEEFDRLLAATPTGGEIAYDHAQPKWIFLRYLVEQGYLLHGSNEPGIEEFRTRPQRDAHGNPISCRATTRRGTPCRREPLGEDGYCPSHQHLAETEDAELVAA